MPQVMYLCIYYYISSTELSAKNRRMQMWIQQHGAHGLGRKTATRTNNRTIIILNATPKGRFMEYCDVSIILLGALVNII